MALQYTTEGLSSAAENLVVSAKKINELTTSFDEVSTFIRNNYSSDDAAKLISAFDKVNGKGPDFEAAVSEFAKYITDTVIPAYSKVEQKSGDVAAQING